MSEENHNSNSKKNALCYIPFVAIFIAVTEDHKDELLKKHIKYGILLLVGYIFISFLVSMLLPFLSGLLTLVYLGISGYFGYKAYSGEDFEIKELDSAHEKIKETLK